MTAPALPPTTGGDAASSPQRHGRLAAALLSPTLIVLALIVLYPLISALRESLYRREEGLDESGFVVEGDKFVAIDNYMQAFTGEAAERFWNAFFNTTFFTIVGVTIEVVLGIAMALVMHHALRGRGIVRASILVPWAVPTAMSAVLWQWIFQADGVANEILNTQILWTTEGFQAKLAVLIADTWKTAPFVGLLVLAGLQIIPNDVYEAARVDGASGWRQFWRITLPLVRPALMVAVLFRVMDVLRIFDLPYVLIGARKHSVETLSMLAFEEANQVRYGPAATYATILFLYVAIVAYAFVKLLGADLLGEARVRNKESRMRRKAMAT
ncbi:carbohydrate ABC transporter permease [Actinophytocola xanthii]|uniref:carbohydrate ABC transporter permease n=1 Tax=Actinophytocola xanthii TaxID=1912961 RepID=UPI000AECC6B1|nr:sugar ABC transporter permease [Actinophytocola xanthii]